jgi:beta-lactam-binding protein with PASTA domain
MTVYNGRYELTNQVARGGTAQVYLARDLLLDRPVALKVLFPELSADPTFVERFRREAQAAANLSHPNIVPVFDWGQSESTYFIVMEYVDGEALSAIIRTQSPLDQSQAASITSDIAKALSYAHRHGVVHRDVKPGNVLITSDGQVKVTDFGIARAMGSDEQVTQTGLVMGTATYFSPEQAQGLEVDQRSDIYSLGVVLYEMLTGKPPFSGENPVSIAYQHVRETPAAPRSVNPAISASLEAIVSQAMAKLPAERYQSADEFRADLDRFVRGQTVLARPPSEVTSSQQATMVQQTVAGPPTVAMGQVSHPPPPGPPPAAAPARRKKTTPFWLAAGGVLLLIIAAAVVITGRSLGYFGGAKYFHVPYVMHEQATTAEATLRAHGLNPVVHRTVATSVAEAHTVVGQNPDFPANVRKGDSVNITVAGNAPTKGVPSVVGEQSNDASKAITAAGFKVKEKLVQGIATDKQGVVKSQSPGANSQAQTGSTVTISVVTGTRKIRVPSVANESQPAATLQLTTGGRFLVNTTLQTQYSATVAPDNVIATLPPANSLVAFGSQVTLVISNGPGKTAPIITLREPATQALSDILAQGLNPIEEARSTTNPNVVGLVFKACLPDPNSSAVPSASHCTGASGAQNLAPGSTIYVFVWQNGTGNSGGNTGTSTTTIPTTTTTVPTTPPPVT